MREAADALEFERASVLRDKLEAVRAVDAVRQMELDRPEDLDVIGIAEDELEAAVQVFHVRSGKVVGRMGMFVDKVEDLSAAQLIERILVDVYAEPAAGVPKQILVPTMPGDSEAVLEYLAHQRGGPVDLRVPVRGPKRALLRTGRVERERRLRPSPAPPQLGSQQQSPRAGSPTARPSVCPTLHFGSSATT